MSHRSVIFDSHCLHRTKQERHISSLRLPHIAGILYAACVKYEHLVQINDPLNPLIDPLTRDQLWRGLMRYVESPVAFVQGLDSGTVTARRENQLQRELQFGRLRVCDEVTLVPMQSIHVATCASAEIPAGSLTITIEDHGTELLFVRFLYQTFPMGHPPVGSEYREVVKEAYKHAGIDIIRRIREYADEGRLDRMH